MNRWISLSMVWALLAFTGCKEQPFIELVFEGETPLNSLVAAEAVKEEDAKKKVEEAKTKPLAERIKAKDTRKISSACSRCGKPVGWNAASCPNANCKANGVPYAKVPAYKCVYCKGTGVCAACRVWGTHEGPKKGRCYNCELIQKQNDVPRGYVKGHTLDWQTPIVCTNCDGGNRCPLCRGSAECDFCHGDGELDDAEIRVIMGVSEVTEEDVQGEDGKEKKKKKKKEEEEEEEEEE